jgi:hypothetical protein
MADVARISLLASLLEQPDVRIQVQFQREMWERHYPLVSLIRRDRTATNVDPLRIEAPVEEWLAPVQLRARVEHSPSKQRLLRWGIEEDRDCIVSFSTLLLDDLGILAGSSNFLVGDLVRFDDDLYEIREQHRPEGSYWGNTNIPFFVSCACSRYKFSA